MMDNNSEVWVSPDGKIKKSIILNGAFGAKPMENSECQVKVASCHLDVKNFNMNEAPVIIGQIDTAFGRLLEKCLMTMHAGEIANVTFQLQGVEEVSSIVELKSFTSDGCVYYWNARKKYDLANAHKNRGVELYKTDYYVDASHRFSKGVKLLASIPIGIEDPPNVVDGINVSDIYRLKYNLYNNLASCYVKHKEYETVIDLCKKVLEFDGGNVKALYKLGVAYDEVHSFDSAHETLKKLLSLDPSNKAAAERLKMVVGNVNETNARINAMVKKMFV